jgi:hypothetical protein
MALRKVKIPDSSTSNIRVSHCPVLAGGIPQSTKAQGQGLS